MQRHKRVYARLRRAMALAEQHDECRTRVRDTCLPQSSIPLAPRLALMSPRRFLPSSRRFFDASVGLVGRRGTGRVISSQKRRRPDAAQRKGNRPLQNCLDAFASDDVEQNKCGPSGTLCTTLEL